MFNFEMVTDDQIFKEAVRRLRLLAEQSLAQKFEHGQIEFIFWNGDFVRIDIKPSIRIAIDSMKDVERGTR